MSDNNLRLQVILNAVCTFIKNLDNRLIAVMTENSAKNNKVEDLNQQCTIKFYQLALLLRLKIIKFRISRGMG